MNESIDGLIQFLNKKIEWVGWRIGSPLENASKEVEGVKEEISKLNLTLQEVNDTLKKIAEKD